MNSSTPFEVSPEAAKAISSLLQRHPESQAALWLIPGFEQYDEQGVLEVSFQEEHFMMAYDKAAMFSEWPRVDLCGQSVPIAPDGLEKLRGKRLALEQRDLIHLTGAKESRDLLVAQT